MKLPLPHPRARKRVAAKALAALLAGILLFSVCFGFAGCSSGAPSTEEIYDRVVELIENSYAVNTVFYGAGLPVVDEDSFYAAYNHLYYDFDELGNYRIVKGNAKFLSSDAIKAAAEKVYSKDFLESTVYKSAFEGYAASAGGTAYYTAMRFLEDGNWIYQSTQNDNYLTGIRVYDYSSMKVVAPSSENSCFVQITSWLESPSLDPSNPPTPLTHTLKLARQNNQWFLDSFTG